MTPEKRCKDCAPGAPRRRAPHQGPRCATHWRAYKKTRATADRDRHIRNTYGIEPSDYEALYEAQDGKCYVCRRATGKSKSLAVDHDHSCCPGRKSCGKCIRALLCSPCNVRVLGHLRDDVDALRRAIEVIERHPAQSILIGLNE